MKNLMDRRTSGDHSTTQAEAGVVRVPVLEEVAHIEIKKIETGKVRAIKHVHEENVLLSSTVSDEELIVERIPVNEYVDVAPQARHEGDTMIIPVVKEEVIVQTRLMLVEEVRITRRREERTVQTPVTLRTEEVIIERSSVNTNPSDKQK